MFELRTSEDESDDALVEEARRVRNEGYVSFQIFAPHGGRGGRSPQNSDDDFETARLVDLLEAEGWTLENVAHAAERADQWAYGVDTVRVVGTIYTFRMAAAV